MKIAVLLKRVPDLVEDLVVDASGKALDADEVKLTLNEFDDHALEEALLLKESVGASVAAIALEGEDVDKMLFTALAKGADQAIKVTGVAPVERNLQLARVFAKVVEEGGYDLLLTGVQATDDRDGQVGAMVAALLERPFVSVVTSVLPEGEGVKILKEYAGGVMAEFEVSLPSVLGIQAARQAPRYAPVSKVRQVQQDSTLETVDCGAAEGMPGMSVVVMTPPERGEGAQMLDSVEEVIEVLASKGVI